MRWGESEDDAEEIIEIGPEHEHVSLNNYFSIDSLGQQHAFFIAPVTREAASLHVYLSIHLQITSNYSFFVFTMKITIGNCLNLRRGVLTATYRSQ